MIDAAYGTGFRGEYDAPDPGRRPVLAVDIPSGVDGLTGEAAADPVRGDRDDDLRRPQAGAPVRAGPLAGRRGRASPTSASTSAAARAHLVEAADVAGVAAGPPGRHPQVALGGVGHRRLAGHDRRAGAGRHGRGPRRRRVRPAVVARACRRRCPAPPVEVVGTELAEHGWADDVLGGADASGPSSSGPGSATEAPPTSGGSSPRRSCPSSSTATACGRSAPTASALGHPTTVLTPHDGEFERLCGHRPGADRIDAARRLADATNAVVLLKGPTTVVARPGGEVLVVAAGDARLATAGTGDVLSGTIAAFIARGVDPFHAAAAAAFVHGRAATLGPASGLVASDVAANLPAALDQLVSHLIGRSGPDRVETAGVVA